MGKNRTDIKLPLIFDLRVRPDTKHPIDIIEIVPNIRIVKNSKIEKSALIFKKTKKGIAIIISDKSRKITKTMTLDI